MNSETAIPELSNAPCIIWTAWTEMTQFIFFAQTDNNWYLVQSMERVDNSPPLKVYRVSNWPFTPEHIKKKFTSMGWEKLHIETFSPDEFYQVALKYLL